MTKRAERQDEKFIRDVSAIKNALQSIAKDLHYFRKKDEAAAVTEEEKEEPKYTCKDCAAYKPMADIDPNITIHWCELHGCPISYNGLREPCADFVKDGEF